VQSFRNVFPGSTVSGEYSTTLSIGNLKEDMSGWGAYCTFYYGGQTARTSTAYINITNKGQPVPSQDVYGSASGKAYSGGAGYAINLSNGTQIYVDGWKCNVSGTFYDGAPCTVTYMNYPSSDNVTSVAIYGSSDPILDQGGWAGSHYYDTMGGYAGSNYYDNEYYGSDYYVLDDGSVYYEDHDVLGNVLGGGIVYD
jgi:hypothetical protein